MKIYKILIKVVLPIFAVTLILNLFPNPVLSQTKVSFEAQNAGKKFKNFSFGMGASYSNNSSLVDFIKLDFPNYNINSTAGNIKDLDVGVEFFGSAEFQISQNWSLKGEYAYFTKTITLPAGTSYSYSYNSHVPLLNISYIKRSGFLFMKFGVGGGYDYSTFTKTVGISEAKYTTSGFIIKPEVTANAQISNSVAGYISGFVDLKFSGDLKDSDGNLPPSQAPVVGGTHVNLNSQGIGVRLGLSFYIF